MKFENAYFIKVKFTKEQIKKNLNNALKDLHIAQKDEAVSDLGNIIRSKRNLDFYAGGIEITEKECCEYVKFVNKVLGKVKDILSK